MNKINTKKEIRILLLAVASGLVFWAAVSTVLTVKVYSETTQADIAREVIRFHVLANSDSVVDQQLKLTVRDHLLDLYRDELVLCGSVSETKTFLAAHIGEIRACAKRIIAENGFDYPVSVTIETAFFPTKAYGDVVLPPGQYEALRVVIGDGMGGNWWCVMFPPLCYVDVTSGHMDENGKRRLQGVLAEDEYRLITSPDGDASVKIKFKVVEWWQMIKNGGKSI